MPRLQARSFATSEDVREMPAIRIVSVALDDATIGHCTFDPGWRWSTHLASVLGVPTCPMRHLGYSISGAVHVEMEDGQTLDIGPDAAFDIPPGHDKWVVGDEPWVAIEWGASPRALEAALADSGTRSLATVLFTDIVDSTATLRRIGDAAWRDLLAAYNGRLREQLNIFRGREIKTTGDGILAVFDSPTRAAECALRLVALAPALDIEIRAGLHTGEIEVVGDDVRGIAVHTAARVLAAAGPGAVYASAATAALLEGSGVAALDAGLHDLKGLGGPRQLYRLEAVSGA